MQETVEDDVRDAEEQEAIAIIEDGAQGREGEANGADARMSEAKEKSTTPYMTKYERARVLGTRALQIR